MAQNTLKIRLKIKAWILFVICVLVLGIFPPIEAGINPEEFRITLVEGLVGIVPKTGKNPSKAVFGISLQNGDRLITGKRGRVEIATKNGTVIEIGQYSNLEVESLTGRVTSFFLRLGRMAAHFKKSMEKKRRRRTRYQVKTLVAVASVRGTDPVVCLYVSVCVSLCSCVSLFQCVCLCVSLSVSVSGSQCVYMCQCVCVSQCECVSQ